MKTIENIEHLRSKNDRDDDVDKIVNDQGARRHVYESKILDKGFVFIGGDSVCYLLTRVSLSDSVNYGIVTCFLPTSEGNVIQLYVKDLSIVDKIEGSSSRSMGDKLANLRHLGLSG